MSSTVLKILTTRHAEQNKIYTMFMKLLVCNFSANYKVLVHGALETALHTVCHTKMLCNVLSGTTSVQSTRYSCKEKMYKFTEDRLYYLKNLNVMFNKKLSHS